MEIVEYFSFLGSLVASDATRIREIISRIAMAKATLKRKKIIFRRKWD
jgi:hypothetical protein